MRIFLYVILFALLSPGMLFHIAAPKGKSIMLKSVIIHAFIFGIAAYILNILVKFYPILDGFENPFITIGESIRTSIESTFNKAKSFVGIGKKRKEQNKQNVHTGSLPQPMKPEEPMKHTLQHTASHGRVGASDIQ